MKLKLQVEKDGTSLYESIYEVADADGFGKACADAWNKLRERRFASATSIGALYETLDERLIDGLQGMKIIVTKAG